jgi:hypothetical protein
MYLGHTGWWVSRRPATFLCTGSAAKDLGYCRSGRLDPPVDVRNHWAAPAQLGCGTGFEQCHGTLFYSLLRRPC